MSLGPDTNNIGFLLAKASRHWNEQLTRALAARGWPQVRASYGSVLLPLWQRDGLRMGTLAEQARLSKQTMTTLVRLAERDNFVTRRPDAADRRATTVWLTPTAIALAPDAAAVVDDLHRHIDTTLGPRNARTLRRALTTLMNLDSERTPA